MQNHSATPSEALAPLTRRRFLQSASALTFAIGSAGLVTVSRAGANETTQEAAETEITAWVRIGTDDRVHLVFPSTEMGQGSSTALPLILAEELDADWDKVEIDQLDRDDRSFGNPIFGNILYTAGSTAVYGYFDSLRIAGAQARRILMRAAAKSWDVPMTEVTTEPGVVLHEASDRRMTFGEIAALPIDDLSVPEVTETDLKPASSFRLIGSDLPRRDIPAKSTGRETYAIDVQVPDMLFAAVLRAPVEGVSAAGVEDSESLAVPGVLRVLTLPEGIAVVAERLEAALAGKDRLQVDWTGATGVLASDSEMTLSDYSAALKNPTAERAVWSEAGDTDAAIAAADRVVEAEYLSDYAYHAQIEPMAAVASVDPDGLGAEVWVGTQTQSWTTRTITETLGTTADRVRLHALTMGGSFGRRTALQQEYVSDALLISKEMGRPVKLVWTREDDVKNGRLRPAAAQRLRAGLTADGALSGWEHRVATPSVIAYFNALRWEQVRPKDIISMRGSESKFYGFPDMRAEHILTERHAPLAPWRGIGASYTSFAAEAFMDELALEARSDPIDFRLALLASNPRGQKLLKRVAEMADWNSPREETALGVSFAGYGDSMAAGIAEIALDRESGVITVQHFWTAVDAGLIVSPDNALAQIEGGIVFGLSSSLKERVTISGGEVEQSNYYDYEILRANEVPEIEIHLEESEARPTGIGEVGTPMVAAAVANAFHALTGRRLRHLPFIPDRVQTALA
ncbi:xanthine dehydrogenase family protein molybdopterin-binding subunit [Denitrobaculum tricleocarpae]|uniref:Xanthine dehydrogenase family protein molybdopterin-binding subunit n=1 Tax=Denitrobaculum tricleocarpae TaxID=2591009 RepID=A0A545SZC7_9PROT|nr:molybdopterin cofactor-binding domain-containing protein [Denitrobaculum tricleocarpae]TQV70324.1 xanthine dehydrogenase family protein molybdopterin-binding subunit [Denitrobaculum tricleocarpae]